MKHCLLSLLVVVLTQTMFASDAARKAAEKEQKAEIQLQQMEERQQLREEKYAVQLQKAIDAYNDKVDYSRELERIREEPVIQKLPVERYGHSDRNKRVRGNGRDR